MMGPNAARRAFGLVLGAWLAASPAFAQAQSGPEDAEAAEEHRHDPVELALPPIVTRVNVPLVHPRRLRVDQDGALLIADWGAGTVTRIDVGGTQSLVARGLDEPAGIAVDGEGNVYVSVHAHGIPGAGYIVRISPVGEQTRYAEELTGPTAIAFDRQGALFVVSFQEGTISRVASSGELTQVADNIPQPSALAFEGGGDLYVASAAAGSIFRVARDGEVKQLATGLSVPSDLAFDAEGHLIVANYGGRELVYMQPNGQTTKFASVPKGTISVAFDRDGNMHVVNWDNPMLLKVTSNLSLPCPHCKERIPVRLRGKPTTNPEKADGARIY